MTERQPFIELENAAAGLAVGETLLLDFGSDIVIQIKRTPTGSFEAIVSPLGISTVFDRLELANWLQLLVGFTGAKDLSQLKVRVVDVLGRPKGQTPETDGELPGSGALSLAQRVSAFMSQLLGIPESSLQRTEQGHLTLQNAQGTFQIRVNAERELIDVLTVVETDVNTNADLAYDLNRWNRFEEFRLLALGQTVYALVKVPAAPFVGQQLERALLNLSSMLEFRAAQQSIWGGRPASPAEHQRLFESITTTPQEQ